ncbi:WapI family immunity protein [Paenibacillus kyungheensis]
MLWVDGKARVEIKILGYQYECIEEWYDDWLTVQIIAQDQNGFQWEAISPSMMTSELKGLRDWLISVRDNQMTWKFAAFMEPEIEISYIEDGQIELSLSHAFYPKKLIKPNQDEHEKKFIISSTKEALQQKIEEIDKMLAQFPERCSRYNN